MALIRRRRLPFVRRQNPSDERDAAAALQKLAELAPEQRIWLAQVVLGAGLLAGSSPVELSVPAIRAVAGKRGVQTGAAMGSLLSFLVGQAYVVVIRRQLLAEDPVTEGASRDPFYDRWLTRAIVAGAVVLPAAGAALTTTVVLRRQSPLWGFALWLVVRLVAASVLATDASRLKRRVASNGGADAVVGH